MELLSSKESSTVALCNHSFHRECLNFWKLRSNSCPLCRGDTDGPALNPIALDPIRPIVNPMVYLDEVRRIMTDNNYDHSSLEASIHAEMLASLNMVLDEARSRLSG